MDQNNKVWIYCLKDPRDNSVKYVGKSINPEKRLKEHIDKCNIEHTKKGNWLKKLNKLNLKPILEILKETDETEYKTWEEYYIKYYKDLGVKLTNYDDKGIGCCKIKSKSLMNKIKKKISKKVHQYDLNGNYIKTFNSFRDAERETGINHGNISKCCKGIYNHLNGYVYRKEKTKKINPVISKKAEKKKVAELDKDGNLICIYESIADAAKKTGVDSSNISRVCSGKFPKASGKYFKFIKESEYEKIDYV